MIQEGKQGSEDILRQNDKIRRAQQRKEDIQRQEEALR